MYWKRIVHVSICLLLVFALLFHMSPIKAEALALEASVMIGLVGSLILASAGVVFVPDSINQIQAIGQSFKTYMYQWGTSAEKLDEVDEWFSGLKLYDPSGGDDDDDDWVSPNDRKVKLARGILAGISAWCASIILGNIQVEEETDLAPDGYMYFGSMLLPALRSDVDLSAYPYVTIGYVSTSVFPYCLFSSQPLYVNKQYVSYNSYWELFAHEDTDILLYYSYNPVHVSGWDLVDQVSAIPVGSPVKSFNAPISNNSHLVKGELWTNYDLYGSNAFNSSQLILPASAPSSVKTSPVLPSTYVGDIPQQVQDGALEPGGIELPDINYDALIQPGVSLQDAVVGTMNKLSTGELSYEEFLNQIVVQPSPDPEPAPEPSVPVDPDSDVDADTVGNTSLSTFINRLIDPINEALQDLGDVILGGIRDIFVPSSDYLSAKVDALCAEFSFADSITKTAKGLIDGLQGISTEPPVIYIDLSANTGPYDLGGEVPFLDLRWYAAYKPTVDTIISAFLWACFIWRMFLKLPGIINGASGTFTLIHSRDQEDI